MTGLAGCANLALRGDGHNTFGTAAAGGESVCSTMPNPVVQAGASLVDAATGRSDAAKEAPKDPLEGQFALARLWERRGESDDAEQAYRKLLEKTPRDARLHHRLGVLAVQKGDFAKAEDHFRTARSLAPPTAELLSDMGYCSYLQHRLPEAEADLNEALRLEPTHAAAINNLALVLGRQGRSKEALDLFQRTNSEAEACANLAYVLAQNGELAQAEQMYLRALTLDNRMRAAAQAMLQVNQRGQIQSQLASNSEPMAPAPIRESATRNVATGFGNPVRLPQVAGHPLPLEAAARSRETRGGVQPAQAVVETGGDVSNTVPRADRIPCYVDNGSS
jgi:Flp pilus assembly protein TadD